MALGETPRAAAASPTVWVTVTLLGPLTASAFPTLPRRQGFSVAAFEAEGGYDFLGSQQSVSAGPFLLQQSLSPGIGPLPPGIGPFGMSFMPIMQPASCRG